MITLVCMYLCASEKKAVGVYLICLLLVSLFGNGKHPEPTPPLSECLFIDQIDCHWYLFYIFSYTKAVCWYLHSGHPLLKLNQQFSKIIVQSWYSWETKNKCSDRLDLKAQRAENSFLWRSSKELQTQLQAQREAPQLLRRVKIHQTSKCHLICPLPASLSGRVPSSLCSGHLSQASPTPCLPVSLSPSWAAPVQSWSLRKSSLSSAGESQSPKMKVQGSLLWSNH